MSDKKMPETGGLFRVLKKDDYMFVEIEGKKLFVQNASGKSIKLRFLGPKDFKIQTWCEENKGASRE